jgi:hypothetical protein
MFCPNCGKDNSLELKFCASCGTNLEAVSLALTGREEDFFTKMETGMDFFIARYSEHVFKNAPQGISEHKISKSWKLLGQALITSIVDILLCSLMWNLLPLRFLILVISTPIRLLSERGKPQTPIEQPAFNSYQPPSLPESRQWIGEEIPSVVENTTLNLTVAEKTKKSAASSTDRLT